MSWSLAKRGLELCEEEYTASKSKKVDKVTTTTSKDSRVQKERKSAKLRKIAHQNQQKTKSLFSQKQVVSALDKYQQKAPRDRTLDNIKLLKKIDKKRTPQEYVEKILSQHNKELERRGGKQELEQTQGKKKTQKETSVFSDEDFEKMNKEWLKLY